MWVQFKLQAGKDPGGAVDTTELSVYLESEFLGLLTTYPECVGGPATHV